MPPYKKDKKKGNVKNKASSPCKYYQRGKCANRNCPYLHVKESNQTGTTAAGGAASSGDVVPISLLSTMLKLFFEKQIGTLYDVDDGLLDLSALSAHDDLASVGAGINYNTKNFCVALCSCISLLSPLPTAIDLGENQITSLHHFSRAMIEKDLHLPLRSLSLRRNELAHPAQTLHELKPFTALTELDLRENPLLKEPSYSKESVRQALPWLLSLNGDSLTPPPLSLPWPIFKDPNATFSSEAGVDRAYTHDQKNLLHFVLHSLIAPLESSEGASGVDAVSDGYAKDSTFTLTLTSPTAAVSTPTYTATGERVTGAEREVVREIVALRLRQTEANHNLEKSGQRSIKVAYGRTEVCNQLVSLLYPQNFVVGHFLHPSPSVVILDNKGNGPGAVPMKEPVNIVTLHGVMMWRFRHIGPRGAQGHTSVDDPLFLKESLVIKRNFTREIVIANAEPGRWHITNDAVTLSPFSGREPDDTDGLGGVDHPVFRDLHYNDVLFNPRADPHRSALLGRRFAVPAAVVHQIAQWVQTDLEMTTVLQDISGVPLDTLEQCASLVQGNPLYAVLLCRLGNKYGIDPTVGVNLLQQYHGDWDQMVAAVQSGLVNA